MNFSPNMVFLNRSFDKKRLKALLLWFRLNLSESAALEAVEILQGLGFRSATQGAISLGLDDLKTPASKGGRVFQAQLEVALAHHEHHRGNRTPVELFQHLVDTWHRTSQDLTTEVVQLFHSTERVNPVYMMAFSGARGNLSQVRQLVGMRGLMADPRGQIVGFPILSNFREGLTITEYFVSCYGARKGVVDTAIRTADAGYLTRRLADVSHHFVVRTTNCGTHRNIRLRDIKEGQKTILPLASRLVGRVLAEHIPEIAYRNEEITPDLAAKLASQCLEISVRSPLSCSLRWGVCQLCYGWGLSEGRRVTLGEAVGIIAAQSIGEPGTQLTLRTFHTGGVFSGDLLNEIRAPFSGTILFPEPLQGLLVRTPHGQIAFLTKVSGKMIILPAAPYTPFLLTPLPLEPQRGFKGISGGKEISNESSVCNSKQSTGVILKQDKNPPMGGSQDSQAFSIQSKEFSLQPSTVIFVRQKEEVYPNQLLAEFSSSTLQPINDQIEVTQQVLSEAAGQVWFKEIEYGNRKGSGSGSLGTHFSSEKLGGIWVLAGKPTSDILLKDRQLFSASKYVSYPPMLPMEFPKEISNPLVTPPLGGFRVHGSAKNPITRFCSTSSTSLDVPSITRSLPLTRRQLRCPLPSMGYEPPLGVIPMQRGFKENEKTRGATSFRQSNFYVTAEKSIRFKSYKTSVINLHNDSHFLKYNYSLGYSQFMSLVSSENNKVHSIYFKNSDTSAKPEVTINISFPLPEPPLWFEISKGNFMGKEGVLGVQGTNMKIGSNWRPCLMLSSQRRGVFEKKRHTYLLSSSTSARYDELVTSPHLLISKIFSVNSYTMGFAFQKPLAPEGGAQPPYRFFKPNPPLRGSAWKVTERSCCVQQPQEEIYGWRSYRYRANPVESVFVNSDQISIENLTNMPLFRNLFPPMTPFGGKGDEKETGNNIHSLLGTDICSKISVKNEVAWWLPKEWKTTSGMLLGESFFSNKERTEGQLFWLSSSFTEQEKSVLKLPEGGGAAPPTGLKPLSKPPLIPIIPTTPKGIKSSISKADSNRRFEKQAGDFEKQAGISTVTKTNNQVKPPFSCYKLKSSINQEALYKSGLIVHHPLGFFCETHKSQNVPIIKKLIGTLDLNRLQYSATNRKVFSPLQQNYTFESFTTLIDCKMVKKIKNLLTFNSFWQALSLSNYPNRIQLGEAINPKPHKMEDFKPKGLKSSISWVTRGVKVHDKFSMGNVNRKDVKLKHLSELRHLSDTFSTKKKLKYNTVSDQRFKNFRFTNHNKKKGKKQTIPVQKPIWLSVNISNNNLFSNPLDVAQGKATPYSLPQGGYGVNKSNVKSPNHQLHFGSHGKGVQYTGFRNKIPSLRVWFYPPLEGGKTTEDSQVNKNNQIGNRLEISSKKRRVERNDGSLDQHIVHTIKLPIVPFSYIVSSRPFENQCMKILTRRGLENPYRFGKPVGGLGPPFGLIALLKDLSPIKSSISKADSNLRPPGKFEKQAGEFENHAKPSKCNESLTTYYYSKCSTPVQGNLLPLIRQSLWEENFFNFNKKDSALSFVLATLGLVKPLTVSEKSEKNTLGLVNTNIAPFCGAEKGSKSLGMKISDLSPTSFPNFVGNQKKEYNRFLKTKEALKVPYPPKGGSGSKTLLFGEIGGKEISKSFLTPQRYSPPMGLKKVPMQRNKERKNFSKYKMENIILERLEYLKKLNKEKFTETATFSFDPLEPPKGVGSNENLTNLWAKDKSYKVIPTETLIPKNYALFTFISSSAVEKFHTFYSDLFKQDSVDKSLRVSDIDFIVSLPIKIINNPQGRYTSSLLKSPRENVVVTSPITKHQVDKSLLHAFQSPLPPQGGFRELKSKIFKEDLNQLPVDYVKGINPLNVASLLDGSSLFQFSKNRSGLISYFGTLLSFNFVPTTFTRSPDSQLLSMRSKDSSQITRFFMGSKTFFTKSSDHQIPRSPITLFMKSPGRFQSPLLPMKFPKEISNPKGGVQVQKVVGDHGKKLVKKVGDLGRKEVVTPLGMKSPMTPSALWNEVAPKGGNGFSDNNSKSSSLQEISYTSCYRLMRRIMEYPVERSSLNKWITTKRKKLKYSPILLKNPYPPMGGSGGFINNFVGVSGICHAMINEVDQKKGTRKVTGRNWLCKKVPSKKFTGFQNPIYLYWYAFPLGTMGSLLASIQPFWYGMRNIPYQKALKNIGISYPLLPDHQITNFFPCEAKLLSEPPVPPKGGLRPPTGFSNPLPPLWGGKGVMEVTTTFTNKVGDLGLKNRRFFTWGSLVRMESRFASFHGNQNFVGNHGKGVRKKLNTVCEKPLVGFQTKGGKEKNGVLYEKYKTPFKKATMPFLCESDQVTFAINDVLQRRVLLPSYQEKSTRSTIWQSKSYPQKVMNPRRGFKSLLKSSPSGEILKASRGSESSDLQLQTKSFRKSEGENIFRTVPSEYKEKNAESFFLFPGQLVAYGEKIAPNIATTESGQVLYVDSQRTTFRKAQTVLIYSQAIIAVLSGEWIKKGTPLMALSYQKLVTGDIVQGLPKIEQFFEAPLLKDGTFWSDSLQAKLNLFFQEHREKLPLAEAVRKGFSDIQRVLVEGVQRVYISQGVLIADKHLEVIVRQMTCKGRILYSGDTGFLRNELVSLDKIESVNQVTYGQKALYHPQVRGITDASLESESFLSAASFQETTRVLSRDAVIGKTDLMRGLKERVIVGELIQAGTGLANNSVYNLLLNDNVVS